MIFCATLLSFWPTLVGLPGTWSASYQEHGFFVGALIVWLVWRDRYRLLATEGQGPGDFLPVLALVSLLWMLTLIMTVRVIQQALLPLLLMGWAFVVFGWAARRTILTIGLTFMLAVPFWGLLVPILQRGTVMASGGATQLAGISAVIGYDYIQITTGTFLIEEGCAGLNYLMGGLVLGAYYAHLFTDRWQTQLKIITLAGAVSIVGNWIRVATLIFLGESTAMQSPYIEDHLWQGWAIFSLLMVPTYFAARRIEIRDAAAAAHASSLSARAPGDVGAERIATEPGTSDSASETASAVAKTTATLDPLRTRRAAIAGLAAASGPILFMFIGAVPRGDELDRDVAVLGVVAPWSASEGVPSVDDWSPAFFGIDDETTWTLEGDGPPIAAARHYFLNQRQGEELIQYNNKIAPDSLVATDRLIGPVGPRNRFVHEVLMRGEDGPRIVWYWYRVAGFDTPFATKAKLLEVLAFFRRSPASELVTLTAACGPESCRDAASALRSALGARPLPPQDASGTASP